MTAHRQSRAQCSPTFYGIGQLAALAGVISDTLRYCEKEGLLVPQRKGSGSYRTYDDDVERLRVIRHAQECGFTLYEVRALLCNWPART